MGCFGVFKFMLKGSPAVLETLAEIRHKYTDPAPIIKKRRGVTMLARAKVSFLIFFM